MNLPAVSGSWGAFQSCILRQLVLQCFEFSKTDSIWT